MGSREKSAKRQKHSCAGESIGGRAGRVNTMSNIRDRVCKACCATFPGGPHAFYCPACRQDRRRAVSARLRKSGVRRPLGSKDRCVICGDEYIVLSGRQKYCGKCAPEAVKAVDRAQGLAYYEKNKEDINPVRKISRRITGIICPICGKTFDADGKPNKTCSLECRRIRKNQQWREKYYKPRRKPK